jgi:hypothetical protein
VFIIDTWSQMNFTIDRCLFAECGSTATFGGVIYVDELTTLFPIIRTRFENNFGATAIDIAIEATYNCTSYLSLTSTSCSTSQPRTRRVRCGGFYHPEILKDCETDIV